MFYESIGNMEYHNFFITPYGDPIEEAVFTLDTFGFIKNVDDIKEAHWYYYDNEANYKPQKNMIQSYEHTLFYNER